MSKMSPEELFRRLQKRHQFPHSQTPEMISFDDLNEEEQQELEKTEKEDDGSDNS